MSKNNRDLPNFDNFDADAFTNGVLGRTSGQACDRAAEQLGDLMDNRLQGMDRQLVQAHLENCNGCRQLAVTMGWLTPLLPQMATIEPGPEFLDAVLARTTKARRPVMHTADPTGLAGLMDRFGRWWEQQILRPQFALQVAYVATVVLVLLTATPYSPFRNMPGQALQVVSAGPQDLPVIGPAMTNVGGWVEGNTSSAVDAGRGRVRDRWQMIEDGLARRVARTTGDRGELKIHWSLMIAQAQEQELSGAGYELLATLQAGKAVWNQWWYESEQTSGP